MEEVGGGDGALPPGPRATKVASSASSAAGQVGRGVAVRDRPAERAAVADLVVADLGGDGAEHAALRAEHVARLEVAVAGERADREVVAARRGRRRGRRARPTSTSTAGVARRSFMSGSSDMPPARSLASSPCSASAASASSALAGADVVERGGDHGRSAAAASTARTMLW